MQLNRKKLAFEAAWTMSAVGTVYTKSATDHLQRLGGLEGSRYPRERTEPRLYRYCAVAIQKCGGDAREHHVLRHCAVRQVRHIR
jgi:hypothetical protein